MKFHSLSCSYGNINYPVSKVASSIWHGAAGVAPSIPSARTRPRSGHSLRSSGRSGARPWAVWASAFSLGASVGRGHFPLACRASMIDTNECDETWLVYKQAAGTHTWSGTRNGAALRASAMDLASGFAALWVDSAPSPCDRSSLHRARGTIRSRLDCSVKIKENRSWNVLFTLLPRWWLRLPVTTSWCWSIYFLCN
jgi:hypothetical protein